MKSNKKYQKIMENAKKYLICVDKSSIIIVNFQKIGKNEKKTPVSKSKRKKCYVNVVAMNNGAKKNVFSHREVKGVKKDVKMNTVNILDAANFLIQLYYKTKRGSKEKYKCTCTQIEKLLIIANLIFFINDDSLFDDEMWLNDCGVSIPLLKHYFYTVIIDDENTNKPIPQNNIEQNAVFPDKYSVGENSLSKEIEKVLTDVFLRFGGYSAFSLGEMFDEFKSEISVKNPKDEYHPLISKDKTIMCFSQKKKTKTVWKNEICDFTLAYKFPQLLVEEDC